MVLPSALLLQAPSGVGALAASSVERLNGAQSVGTFPASIADENRGTAPPALRQELLPDSAALHLRKPLQAGVDLERMSSYYPERDGSGLDLAYAVDALRAAVTISRRHP